jgi:hypothetical protein
MRIARRLPWTLVVPALALIALGATWGRKPGDVVLALVAALLAGAVLASVHFVLTAGIGALTILPGPATLREGGLHRVIFGRSCCSR